MEIPAELREFCELNAIPLPEGIPEGLWGAYLHMTLQGRALAEGGSTVVKQQVLCRAPVYVRTLSGLVG